MPEGFDLERWLLGVVALILMFGSLIVILQKLQNNGGFKKNNQGRLRVRERLVLDGRRRLVIVEHDDKEHLILLGHQHETLISSGKKKTPKRKPAAHAKANPQAENQPDA